MGFGLTLPPVRNVDTPANLRRLLSTLSDAFHVTTGHDHNGDGMGAPVAGLAAALAGEAAGLGLFRVARAEFNPSLTAGMRTIAAHGLGQTLPDNAIICGGFHDVITTFTSATDAATIAISAQGANDLVSALAISNGANIWDAGLHPLIPKANTPETTGIKLTAAREITATVAVEALTAGKSVIYVLYLPGA